MIYSEFADIPFQSRHAGRLTQIYAVLYFMRQGQSHIEAIHNAKDCFPSVTYYQTIQDKCTRQFAGSTHTFVEWYESGEMLPKLRQINGLNDHDSAIFKELLEGDRLPSYEKPGKRKRKHTQLPMSHAQEVDTAFEIVLEEIENAIEGLNRDGSHAFERGDYDLVQSLRHKGTQMAAFRDKALGLQQEWNSIFAPDAPTVVAKRTRKPKRLSKGLRTRESAFRVPILRALVKMGGSAPAPEIISAIAESVKVILNKYDLSTLPSTGLPRWQNTAHWARNQLVKEGLMSSNSPRGIWEITERGRAWLDSNEVENIVGEQRG